MKTIFTFFISSLLAFSSKAQWIELDTGMENPPVFNDVYAITPDIVVVVGANGTILKTTDGGQTWQQKPSGTTNGLSNVQFSTPDMGYIIGGGSTFLKTPDGGETWVSTDIGEIYLSGLSCVNENLIFVSGYVYSSGNTVILKSENGGNTFSIVNTDIDYHYPKIQFLNMEVGFLQGEWNSFFKTENGGENWQELEVVAPFYFLNENIGFIYDGSLRKTTNGAYSFEWVCGDGTGRELNDIFVVNENNVWGIIQGDWDDLSTQGITNIIAEPCSETIAWEGNPEIDMFSIHFANENTGYIVGKKNGKGAIWKNGTGINTMGTIDEGLNGSVRVYPNPASKEINIEIQNGNLNNFSILLTDISGKQVYSQSFNTNKISINTERFPKGIYILSIKTNEKNYTKKIIIN